MSEATIFECPYNLFLKQRLEFVVICDDHLAANVMRIFEREMIKLKETWQVRVEKALESKKTPPPEPKSYWVRLSQAQIIARLYMYDSAKIKKPDSDDPASDEWAEYHRKKALSISKGTLRKAIDLLIGKGFLIERSKPGEEFGAPIYTLHKVNVQKALKALPSNPFTIFHYLGGVENFEPGGDIQNLNLPPTNFEPGEMQNLEVPPTEIGSGDIQNLEVNIDSSIDLLEDIEIDNEIEDTGNVAHRELPTPAPSSLETTPYRPELTGQSRDATYEEAWEAYKQIEPRMARTNQMLANGEMPTLKAVDTPQGDANGYHATPSVAAELSTSQGSSPQVSAKVEPKPPQPSSKVVANGKSNIPATAQVSKPQLTLLGGQVREWYDIIRATRTRLTAKNVEAFNVLSELDGMSFESLKEVMDSIEDDPWVKARPTFTFDAQDLASEDGKWRFDRWYQVVQRNRQRQASQSSTQPPPTSSSLPSFSGMSDKEYYASLRGGTSNARTAHAR